MKDTDIAWLAGWLEGEGCFSINSCRHGAISIQGIGTDKDVIERVARLMSSPASRASKHRSQRKPVYRTVVHADKAASIMKMILPYMGERRSRRIMEVLRYRENYKENYRESKQLWSKGRSTLKDIEQILEGIEL